MTPTVSCIVEGQGEEAAVPVMARRIADELGTSQFVQVRKPITVGKEKLLKVGELERYVELAARKAPEGGGILILLDADEQCPAVIGPQLLERAQQARSDRRMAVVVAKREYEAWFLAGAPSLRGRRGLAEDLVPPSDPEEIRGAKEWLGARMADRSYSATVDQAALTAVLDLQLARQASDSFDKCWREIEGLLST